MQHVVAYYRVSTQRQGQSGLGLEAQQASVRRYASAVGRQLLAEYTEVESGRKCNRPELRAALERAKGTGATLVVAKLDRLTRDARFLLELADCGVSLHFLDLPDQDFTTAVGRMILGIMGHVAEFESRRIGERIKAAYEAKKARLAAQQQPIPKKSREHQQRASAAMHARDAGA